MLNRMDRWWAAAILFMNGWIFALPVTDAALPVWFTPVQVVHGIFVHEVLLATYLAFLFVSRGGYLPSSPHSARKFGFLIAGLGVLGILSAVTNLRPLKELVGAGRYFLLAAYFLASIYWAKKHGPTFVLRTYLLGILCAGVVNVYYTFSLSTTYLGVLPMMLGQNGPGGYLGMAVILSAWLMMVRRTSFDIGVAVASGVIGLFAASISFSKLAMLIAGSGAIGWCFVLLRNLNLRRSRRWYAVIAVALTATLWVHRDAAIQYVMGVNTFIDYKFRSIDPQSIGTRSQYFLITAEILLRHPLFGVSYGGFYDAAMATEAYKTKRSAIEDAEAGARGESNPHSSFLYYASANGVGGLLLVSLLFLISLSVFWRALSRRGVAGKVLWGCSAFGYLIFGLTLPTLFNSSILYLPVAVGICSDSSKVGSRRRVRWTRAVKHIEQRKAISMS